MEIKLSIPERTLNIENNRDIDDMNLEDIIDYCFSVEMKIIGYSNLFIALPETCLFQVIECLSEATKEIISSGKTSVCADDRYNGNSLLIESNNDIVTIKYAGSQLEFFNDDFIIGAKQFIFSALAQAKESFPKLNLNPVFNSAVENWLKNL